MMGRWFRIGRWYLFALVVLAGVSAVGWHTLLRDKSVLAAESATQEGTKSARAVTVEVVQPREGGIDRICVQPGTVEPFESANLYAKASGYLIEQKVDIGGGANADVMASALEVINTDPKVKAIFVNIFGGITRVDDVANGVLEALQRVAISTPIVLRLDGTNAVEGRAILAPHLNDSLITEPTMLDAARRAVSLAND